ncbi:MAG: WYL domain-containing protein [Actinomycetota bacterium]|nr:WYL domain-containing protein [Actinomycetota bacterium]
MDRLERLVNLVAALLDAQRPLSRDELRRRVGGYTGEAETFRRTFERDKDVLRQMGMPLVTEPLDPERPDDQVGYRIPRERYELADPGLDDDELAALRLAASAVAVEGAWGRDATTTALRKLAATGSSSGLPSTTSTDVGRKAEGMALLSGGEQVVAAFAAVAERRSVTFTYRSQPRRVDPWRLSYRKGQWYLSGFDHDRGSERLFRLDRVDGAIEASGPGGAFDRPAASATAPPAPWRLGDGDETVVEVAVDGPWASLVIDEVGTDAVRQLRPDGSVVLALVVTNVAGLRSFVLGLLDHAEVIGPPPVRDAIVAWLTRLVEEPGAPVPSTRGQA